MRLNYSSNGYFWMLNLLSAIFALLSIENKIFCLIGLLLCGANLLYIIFIKLPNNKLFIFPKKIKFGIWGVVLFWFPIYIFSYAPDVSYNITLYYILSINIVIGIAFQVISRINIVR